MISVIGNGQSRQGLDINALQGEKIGCNAIVRDYFVDHLVCVDRKMVKEALDLKTQCVVYTRQDWFNKFQFPCVPLPDLPYNGYTKPDEPIHWGSGPYAVLLGAKLSPIVRIIGFDLYSKDKFLNNIYKDTKNYDSSTKRSVDPRYWIYQIGKVFEIYNRRNFIIYNTSDWALPKEWKYPNVSLDTLDNL